MFLIPIFVTLYADLYLDLKATWSPYVIFSLAVIYIISVLPYWFKKPSPAIFVPVDFVAIALFLHYINYSINGDWFLTLAFPLIAYLGITVTTVSILLYYLKKGHMYVIGALFIALGLFMDIIELFIMITFKLNFDGWSIYPMIPLVLLGLGMIVISISRNARAALARKLHI